MLNNKSTQYIILYRNKMETKRKTKKKRDQRRLN